MAKKKSKKVKEVEKELEELEDELDEELDEDEGDDEGSFLSNPKVIYGFIVIAVVAFVIWQVKGLFVAAMVNNSPITRIQLIEELENRYGQEVLDSMITQQLVEQAAEEQGITVSEDEISNQLTEITGQIEKQGSTLEDLLAQQGQTEEELREGIRLTLLVEKLFKDEVDISEEDVKSYYEQNQEFYGEDVSFEDVQGSIREQIVQQRLSGQFSQWLQQRKDEATIREFVNF